MTVLLQQRHVVLKRVKIGRRKLFTVHRSSGAGMSKPVLQSSSLMAYQVKQLLSPRMPVSFVRTVFTADPEK